MADNLSISGLVATSPRHIVTSEGLAITSFRLASNQRRFDRSKSQWVEADTNWYTITAFRQLAMNTAASVNKGDRIIVSGRLRIRDWDSGERNGTTVEVEADGIGHDLNWGRSSYQRVFQEQSGEGDSESESESFLPEETPEEAQLAAS